MRPEIVTPIDWDTCRHCGTDPADALAKHPPVFGWGGETVAFSCLDHKRQEAQL